MRELLHSLLISDVICCTCYAPSTNGRPNQDDARLLTDQRFWRFLFTVTGRGFMDLQSLGEHRSHLGFVVKTPKTEESRLGPIIQLWLSEGRPDLDSWGEKGDGIINNNENPKLNPVQSWSFQCVTWLLLVGFPFSKYRFFTSTNSRNQPPPASGQSKPLNLNRHQGCSRLLTRLHCNCLSLPYLRRGALFSSTPGTAIASLKQTERWAIRLTPYLPSWTANVKLYNQYKTSTPRDHLYDRNARITNSTILQYFSNHEFFMRDHLKLNHI